MPISGISQGLGYGGGTSATSSGAPTAPAAPAGVTRQSDLVGWWKFNESSGTNAADSSATGQAGTLQNMADSDWVAGKSSAFGNCLEFEGTDDYVSIPANGAFPSSDFSVSTWVYLSSSPPHYPPIIQTQRYYTDGYNGNWTFRTQTIGGQFLGFYAYNSLSAIGGASESITISGTTWYQAGFVFDDSENEVQLYWNGATLGDPVAISGALGDAAASGLYVGRDRTSYYWEGRIDDVRIYGAALSEANMASIYGSGNGDWP